jgi:hypothetical protein
VKQRLLRIKKVAGAQSSRPSDGGAYLRFGGLATVLRDHGGKWPESYARARFRVVSPRAKGATDSAKNFSSRRLMSCGCSMSAA